jgi:hypothetical protein
MRDKTDLGFFVFAHAAFLRICSGGCLAVQRISPKQPFKPVNRAGSQTNLSLHRA